MNKKILVALLVLSLAPAVLFAGVTGKITGRVIDKDTGEPLPGVNVIMEGTMLGAATDINGMFIILNIPVGTYTLKSSYIGYKDIVITNVRVHADLTTEQNFELPTTVLEGETGIFFNDQTPESLIEAVNEFEHRGVDFDVQRMHQHASKFNKKRFIQEIQTYVHERWLEFVTPE